MAIHCTRTPAYCGNARKKGVKVMCGIQWNKPQKGNLMRPNVRNFAFRETIVKELCEKVRRPFPVGLRSSSGPSMIALATRGKEPPSPPLLSVPRDSEARPVVAEACISTKGQYQ